MARKLSERIEQAEALLRNTQTVEVALRGTSLTVEYVVVPALTEEGEKRTPIFNHPAGGTHLAPCIEPFLYLDRRSIVISPLGYGKSSEIPNFFFDNENDNFYWEAQVILSVLEALGEEKVFIFGHSNAAPIVAKAALLALDKGIEVEKLILVNPLGLRRVHWIRAGISFPLSGMLTRFFSWGYESPYDRLKVSYSSLNRVFGLKKIFYELGKSAVDSLPEIIEKLDSSGVSVVVIQSFWDWAKLRWPFFQKSNREILSVFPNVKIVEMAGTHNVTLGRDSKALAHNLRGFLRGGNMMLVISFLPQIPPLVDFFSRIFV